MKKVPPKFISMEVYILFVGKVRGITSGGERKWGIVMTICNIEIVYRHIKCVFK